MYRMEVAPKQSLQQVDSLMFQRPLICTDLSDGLQRLVECVPNLVAGGMTDIVFLHIVLFPEDENIPQADVKRTDRAKERGLIKVQFSALTLALSPRRGNWNSSSLLPKEKGWRGLAPLREEGRSRLQVLQVI